jgi:ribosomal-protein-alanine N-acetyltransferase
VQPRESRASRFRTICTRILRVAWTECVPRLSGDLSLVREVVDADAETLFELLADPVVAEHMSAPPPSVEAFAGFIQWAKRFRARGDGICFGIVPHGLHAAVGIIQIRALEPSFFTAEWGFALGAAFWSTGVFIDAANVVAEFAFTTIGVNRLEARAVINNERAIAAVQKLGARPEAALSRAFRKGSRRDPQQLWTLREDDWRQRPRRDRVSAGEANAAIARAIEQARRPCGPAVRADRGQPFADYPFFITSAAPESDE